MVLPLTLVPEPSSGTGTLQDDTRDELVSSEPSNLLGHRNQIGNPSTSPSIPGSATSTHTRTGPQERLVTPWSFPVLCTTHTTFFQQGSRPEQGMKRRLTALSEDLGALEVNSRGSRRGSVVVYGWDKTRSMKTFMTTEVMATGLLWLRPLDPGSLGPNVMVEDLNCGGTSPVRS